MLTRALLASFVMTVLLGGVVAQQSAPYAGFERRSIKALSTQQIDDLRQGRGMGMALAAELNGYPGPVHVIELGTALDLLDSQLARCRALLDAMKDETVPLGERLIEQETELDRLFATKTVTPETLHTSIVAIASTNAALRAAHLKYHLAMIEVLTPSQVQRYAELRGYGGRSVESGHHRHNPGTK